MSKKALLGALSTAVFLCLSQAYAQTATPLTLIGKTDLPAEYQGDFDHSTYDLKGNRLFVAAEDHGTLEIFNLKTGEHEKTVKDSIDTPHSLLYMPKKNQLLLTDGGEKNMTKIYDADSFKVLKEVKLVPGADSAGYDAPRNRYYIVTGGKDVKMPTCVLSEIDPTTGKHYSDVTFDSDHVEAMAVEQHGDRIYIDLADKNVMDVVDKKTHKIVDTWKIKEAEQNAPVVMDEPNHRLFVITRKPGKLIVLNSQTGEAITSFPAPLRVDEVIWDKANKRIYALGGEGYIGVYQQQDADHYTELAHVPTAPGAKTGVLVPELKTLFVVVSPGEGKSGAALMRFAVAGNS